MSTATPVSGQESFAALFEESLPRQEMRTGEVITAEVVRMDQNFVIRTPASSLKATSQSKSSAMIAERSRPSRATMSRLHRRTRGWLW